MTIELLHHHVQPRHPAFEYGVFDSWKDAGLEPTMKAVQKRVTPRLIKELDRDGKPQYPFLTKNHKQKHEFEKSWLECYQAFLAGNYVEIPDYEPKTGFCNKDHLCNACPNWQTLCQYKNLDIFIKSVS